MSGSKFRRAGKNDFQRSTPVVGLNKRLFYLKYSWVCRVKLYLIAVSISGGNIKSIYANGKKPVV